MVARSIVLNLWTLARPTLAILAFLIIVRVVFFRMPVANGWKLAAAASLTILGLCLFLAGVNSSLIPLSESTGRMLGSARYRIHVVLFACVLGYLATLLEPGLRVLAQQVEDVSVGALPRARVVHTAALGFALGTGLGVGRILFPFSMKAAALGGLLILFLLVLAAPDHVVAIAFDAASAATGPANIPILLGLAIGLAQVVDGADPIRHGFGLIALTAYGTTAAVLTLGLVEARL